MKPCTTKRLLMPLSIAALALSAGIANADVAPITSSGNQLLFGGTADSVAGPSLFWSNNGWGGEKFYNAGAVASVRQDWNAEIVRAAMGVDEPGGYLEDPASNLSRVRAVVDAAIANDMYVIIDWHSHHAEDYPQAAVSFFQQMATEYGQHDNIIYEIYNEPLGVSWSNTIKPYAEQVIGAIRAIDPDNLIVVGTPTWSQDVDAAANDPIISYSNIAYTLHFYAGTHTQYLRDKAQYALDMGIPLFVTEWGTVNANGDGGVAYNETNVWMDFLKANNISHANWALNDKAEGSSALVTGANTTGNWADNQYTASGTFVRDIVRDWSEGDPVDPNPTCTRVNLPGTIEAESFCQMDGIQTEATTDAGGGMNVGWTDAGDWTNYSVNVSAAGRYKVSYRVAAAQNSGMLQLEAAGGFPAYGTLSTPVTGGWQTWQTISHEVDLPAGDQDLAVSIVSGGWNLNWIKVEAAGNTSSSSSSSSSSASGCNNANATPISGNTITVSEGQCIRYEHTWGSLQLGSWSASADTRYDITNCNGQIIADVAQVQNGFSSVNTSANHCTLYIHVKQAPSSYNLQLGSW